MRTIDKSQPLQTVLACAYFPIHLQFPRSFPESSSTCQFPECISVVLPFALAPTGILPVLSATDQRHHSAYASPTTTRATIYFDFLVVFAFGERLPEVLAPASDSVTVGSGKISGGFGSGGG